MQAKTNLNPLPGGADPTKWVQASDWLPLQSSHTGVFNVKSSEYGAVGDGTTDDAAAFQAACDAAAAVAPTFLPYGPVVYVPPGSYCLSKPIKLRASYMRVVGSGASNCFLTHPPSVIWEGPAFQMTGDTAGESIALGTSLLTGAGNSMVVNPGRGDFNTTFLNFSECSGGDFNLTPGGGTGSFTIEFAIFIDNDDATPSGNSSFVLGSNGAAGPNTVTPTNVWTFFITNVAGNYTIDWYITLNGTRYHSNTPVTKGAIHTTALVFESANGKATGYLDGSGTLITTQPGTKPTQSPYESLYLGDIVPGQFPDDSSASSNSFKGRIDGIRFSIIPRYTSNYTPSTSKPTNDANTLLLCNFDTFQGCNVVANAYNGPPSGYNYYLTPRTKAITSFGNMEVSGMWLNFTKGIWWNSIKGHFYDLIIQNCYRAIQFYGLSFIGSGEHIFISGGATKDNTNGVTARYGFIENVATGFVSLDTCAIDGMIFQACMRSPTLLFRNVDMQPENVTHWSYMAYHGDDFDSWRIESGGIDIEQTTTNYEGCIYLAGCRNTFISAAELGSNRSDAVAKPIIQTDATTDAQLSGACPDILTLDSCTFAVNSGATIFQQNGTGRSSIIIQNCRVISNVSSTLSNDTTNIVAIGGQYGTRGNIKLGTGKTIGNL